MVRLARQWASEAVMDAAAREALRLRRRVAELQARVDELLLTNRELSTDYVRLEREAKVLREHRCPVPADAVAWQRQAEQDRHNAVLLEDRLARAEGRPVYPHAPRPPASPAVVAVGVDDTRLDLLDARPARPAPYRWGIR